MLSSVLIFLLVLIAILLVGIILVQSGQGDMGSAMGGNVMNQAFGSQGADKLLVKITAVLATIFMLLAISIQWFGKDKSEENIFNIQQNTPNSIVNEEIGKVFEKPDSIPSP